MGKLDIVNSENSPLAFSKHLKLPPPQSLRKEAGYNLLHFNTRNRSYHQNSSAKQFVEDVLKPQGAKELISDVDCIRFSISKAIELNPIDSGIFLEFGFCTGRSINLISALAFKGIVYGFDSGEGLPEPWRPGFDEGTFAFKIPKSENSPSAKETSIIDAIPFCPLDNTNLVIGRIENTLPLFVEEYLKGYGQPISFIHIDTDVYSTAKSIYAHLDNFIEPGKTVIQLDEGYNYWKTEDQDKNDEWKEHEYRATLEYASEKGYSVQYLAFNGNHQQLVLRFLSENY